jgi:hypothetical protein
MKHEGDHKSSRNRIHAAIESALSCLLGRVSGVYRCLLLSSPHTSLRLSFYNPFLLVSFDRYRNGLSTVKATCSNSQPPSGRFRNLGCNFVGQNSEMLYSGQTPRTQDTELVGRFPCLRKERCKAKPLSPGWTKRLESVERRQEREAADRSHPCFIPVTTAGSWEVTLQCHAAQSCAWREFFGNI